MDKAQAFDQILKVAQRIELDNDTPADMRLSSLIGTIYGCMACVDPDDTEDDGR